MKRFITVMLVMLMMLTLAACGSSSSSSKEEEKAPEKEKQYVGDTEFLSPDEVCETKSKGSETTTFTGDEGYGYDYRVTYTYENSDEARNAYQQYTVDYLKQTFTDIEDSKGNYVYLTDPFQSESNVLSFYVMKLTVIDDALKKELIGKYLMTEFGDYTEQYRKGWEDKTLYMYLDITEDENVTIYLVTDGKKENTGSFTLKEFMNDGSVTYEKGKFTLKADSATMVFEKNDDIPD